MMRTRIFGIVSILCFSVVSAAFGQAPTAPPLPRSLSAGSYVPPTAEQTAQNEQESQLARNAAADLHLGNYARAEAEAREVISLMPGNGVPEEVLAEALERQGKDKEALQQYQTVVEHYDHNSRNLLPYALLLLKSGQWAQAVTAYNHTLLDTDRNELGEQLPLFSPEVPQPAALETAIHLERGHLYNSSSDWAGDSQNTEAMAEYAKALQLAPDNALTNYYYGLGWQKLSPAERVKFGTVQQVKAHLQKAARVGNASVRAAAAKALKALG